MADDDEKDQQIAKLNNDVAELRRKLRASEARSSQLEQSEGGHEAALVAAKTEGAKEARAQFDREHAGELVKAKVQIRAARKLVRPEIAPKLLDMASLAGADDEAIDKAIDELASTMPELAAGTGTPAPPPPPPPPGRGNGNRPTGSADQGPRPPGAGTDPDAAPNDLLRAAAHRR